MHNIEMHYGLLLFRFLSGTCLVLCAVSGDFYRHGGNPLVGLEAVLNLLEVGIGAHYLFL